MQRIGLAVVLALALTLAPVDALAQQTERVYRVGFLSLGGHPAPRGIWQHLLDAMRALDYVEGQNLVVKLGLAEGRSERLPGLVAELLQAKVDVIVTTSTQETQAARKATSTIPIVMTVVPDPVEQGLVKSLARPGGNVTGLTTLAPGTNQKLIELLREAVPSASRFGVLRTGVRSPFPEIQRELETAAQKFGVTLSYVEGIKTPNDFDVVLARAKKNGLGGIVAPLGAFTYAHRRVLAQSALKHRLPGIYWDRDFVEEGGLMSYGVNLGALGRRAAYFVDRLLRGANPADLPVEQPSQFELVINLKTAKTLGLTIPQSLQVRADEIIQ
ncbi:MAG TPA: ABC transporter substrate-binding protein [Methylomirabilota bacterium]|nr:ABC transporter substrate-binding protein [Methylomirabilota bacterium]